MMEVKHLYSNRAEERRKQFNRLINSCNMVLMNNIVDVDDSVWDNWETKSPSESCDIEETKNNIKTVQSHWCNTHNIGTDDEYQCDEYTDNEVYQWFAVSDSDADFLKRHGQYITYSDKLDTYFLAITHFGTSWDYVDSMVEAFNDCYVGLEDYTDEAK